MTKPIRATRDNLLPGSLWQNAAATKCVKIDSRGSIDLHLISTDKTPSIITTTDFLKSDLWYKIQPVKEPTE